MAFLKLEAVLEIDIEVSTDPEEVRKVLMEQAAVDLNPLAYDIQGAKVKEVQVSSSWIGGTFNTAHLGLTGPLDKVVVESDFNGWKMRTESEAWKLQGLLEHMLAQGYKIISVSRAED